MPIAPATNLIFAGVKKRWDERGLDAQVTGGIHQNEPPSGTAMPYAVAEGISDAPNGRTNLTRYRRVAFQISLLTATPEQGGDLAALVLAAFEDEPLEMGGADPTTDTGGLVELWAGPVRYLWNRDRTKLFTILEFMATAARPRGRSRNR